MRILYVGDYAPTGFGKITFNMCREFVRLGHTVDVLGISYYGDTVNSDGRTFDVYSPSNGADYTSDQFGVQRLPYLIQQLRPEIVIIQQDPWNIPAYAHSVTRAFGGKSPVPIVGFLAVDSENHVQENLTGLDLAVFWTKFGSDQFNSTVARGVVPLGIDLDLFKPGNRLESRRKVFGGIPENAWVVGVISRNQWRKRLDLSIAAFAQFRRESDRTLPEPYLFIHALPASPSVDIQSLVKHYGLSGYVFGPAVNQAIPDALIVDIYCAMNCYLSTSAGEGWNYPAQESLACGLPIVVPNNSAFRAGNWIPNSADDRTFRVDCNAPQVLAPYSGVSSYTVGSVPDLDGIVEALHAARMSTEYDDTDADKVTEKIRSDMASWGDSAAQFSELLLSTRASWIDKQPKKKHRNRARKAETGA